MSNNTSLVNNKTKKIISFDNTEIAFKNKTNGYLDQSYWLFKAISSDFLINAGSRIINLAFNVGLPVKPLIKKTIFKHFCGGESIEECEPAIQALADGKVGTILDYSVEGEDLERAFSKTAEEIVRTIRRAKGDSRIPLTVFKVTGVAGFALLQKVSKDIELTDSERVAYFKAKGRVNHICKTAFDLNVPVMIDAEESWIQDAIDILATDMMRMYNREKVIVYNTYQLYRKDKLASLKADVYLAETDDFILGAKLVRGAYLEKERARAKELGYPSPINDTKEATDSDYNEALAFCIEHIKHVAFVAGTHNEESSLKLVQLMEHRGIPSDHVHIYFSQLLGMSDNISFNLADAGYNVAKYVPYGPVRSVLPYLFRRAEENKSIAGQTSRELSLIMKERKRRKKA